MRKPDSMQKTCRYLDNLDCVPKLKCKIEEQSKCIVGVQCFYTRTTRYKKRYLTPLDCNDYNLAE